MPQQQRKKTATQVVEKPAKKTAAKKLEAKPKAPPRYKDRGTPRFTPTPDQRQIVTLMSATGATQAQMRAQITNPATGKPVNEKVFREVFSEELENATAKLNALVAGNLFSIATSKTHRAAATAAIFWLKTRAGWREPESFDVERRRLQFEADMQRGEEVMRFTLVFDEENRRNEGSPDGGDGIG